MASATGTPRPCSHHSTHAANRKTWPADRSNLGEHEQQHLADCDRTDRPRVAGGRAEAELAGEVRAGPDREVREEADRDQDRRQLPLVQKQTQDATPRHESHMLLPRRSSRRGCSRRLSARMHARPRLVRDRRGRLQDLLLRARPLEPVLHEVRLDIPSVTMPRPVSVFVGFISPPEMLKRNSCMIVSKPCR